MSLFTGVYRCKLDAKGRLTLPAKVKSQLPDATGGLVMLNMVVKEPCLELYPMVEARKIYNKVAALDPLDMEARNLQRFMLSRLSEAELDAAGRILIPKHMIGHALLQKEIQLVGVGNRFEIWDSAQYQEHLVSEEAAAADLMKKYLS
jgi:MraZ protein